MTKTLTRIDPILLAIIPNRLEAVAEEMAQTLMMTSRSGIFAEARDFVTGICDAEGRLVAQSRYFPGFACALPYVIPPILEKYRGRIDDGDVFFTNDPYLGNSHLPDMNVLKPVFFDGRLCFWTICKGHMADIGGAGVAGYDPNGETVWDEGVIVPPTKLYVRGVFQTELFELFLSQLKLPEIVRGDIMCEVGGVNIGERGLKALLAKYGVEKTSQHIAGFFDSSERAMREKIHGIADGVYVGEKAIDDDVASDRPQFVRVKITVRAGEVEFDFSDSDPQSPRYMNSTDAFTRSMAALTLFWILQHSQSNYGSLRPIRFVNPSGRCTNASFPASTVLATCTMAECIQEAVQLALAPAAPSLIASPSAKLIFPMMTYYDSDKGRLDVNLDFFFRCTPSGGTAGYDGWEIGGPAQEMGMGRTPDPEIQELNHPVRILRYEQEVDSAGAGQFRGGSGHVYRVKHFAPSMKAIVFGSGTKSHAVPSGLFGGRNPEPSRFSIEHPDGSRDIISPNRFFEVAEGDVLELRSMGGPGYGNPHDREIERVARDVKDGYLTTTKARDVYGVAFDSEGNVEYDATRRLRANQVAAE